jgi:hypothetical protein
MTTYEWDYGSAAAGLQFKVVYNTATSNFTVTVLTGSLNVNALYWSDGDSTAGEGTLSGFTGAKSETSLNMNGSNVLWADDGTSTSATELYDGGLKISNAGLTGTPPDSYIVAGTSHDSFIVAGGTFDPTNFLVLGVRATSTSTAEGSIKWVDEVPIIDQPPITGGLGRSPGYWATHDGSGPQPNDWDIAQDTSFETYFGVQGPYAGQWDVAPPINGTAGLVLDITFHDALGLPNGDGGENLLAKEATTAVLNFLDEDEHNSFVAAYEAQRGTDFSDINNDAAVLDDLKQQVQGAYGASGLYTIQQLTDLLIATHEA